MPEQPRSEAAPALVTAAEVHAELERLVADRSHLGVRNLLGDVFLEPRNPFQPAQRNPKRWIGAAGALLAVALLLGAVFHSF